MADLARGLEAHIASCQTYEGGIGGARGCEAHGGYTFCGVAALVLCRIAREEEVGGPGARDDGGPEAEQRRDAQEEGGDAVDLVAGRRHVALEPAEAVAALGRRVVELPVGAGLHAHLDLGRVARGDRHSMQGLVVAGVVGLARRDWQVWPRYHGEGPITCEISGANAAINSLFASTPPRFVI